MTKYDEITKKLTKSKNKNKNNNKANVRTLRINARGQKWLLDLAHFAQPKNDWIFSNLSFTAQHSASHLTFCV